MRDGGLLSVVWARARLAGMGGIFLTGFGPFGDWTVNSSWEAVAHLAGCRRGLTAVRLPVDHLLAATQVRALAERLRPDVLLLTGLAPDPVARLETVGRAGPLSPHGGPVARRGRWPFAAAQAAVAARGLSLRLSGDAGRYVCDTTYWAALGTRVPLVTFLHLPPPGPVWTPARGAKVVEAVLEAGTSGWEGRMRPDAAHRSNGSIVRQARRWVSAR
jgi:pyroglutamyl-peptidase